MQPFARCGPHIALQAGITQATRAEAGARVQLHPQQRLALDGTHPAQQHETVGSGRHGRCGTAFDHRVRAHPAVHSDQGAFLMGTDRNRPIHASDPRAPPRSARRPRPGPRRRRHCASEAHAATRPGLRDPPPPHAHRRRSRRTPAGPRVGNWRRALLSVLARSPWGWGYPGPAAGNRRRPSDAAQAARAAVLDRWPNPWPPRGFAADRSRCPAPTGRKGAATGRREDCRGTRSGSEGRPPPRGPVDAVTDRTRDARGCALRRRRTAAGPLPIPQPCVGVS